MRIRRRLRGPLLLVVLGNLLLGAALAALLSGPEREVAASAEVPSSQAPLSAGPSTGSDPYVAAVAASRASFWSGPVRVVFAVTGAGTRDALTAGPAAAVLGGPVLPVAADGIPPVVRRELKRLQPGRIVVLGGPAAVSDRAAAELEAFTAGSVTRLAGTDRYETAAQAATTVFTGPVPQVLVVTDTEDRDVGMPGRMASEATRPVLLTTPRGLSAATATALRELRPRSIAVMGEPSQALLRRLQRFTTGPVRVLTPGA